MDVADARERQVARAEHAHEWFDDAGLTPGDTLLDVGCGPGHVAALGADRVGAAGRVYALDRDREAIEFLRERVCGRVDAVVADAGALGMYLDAPAVSLLTYVLHHVEEPAAVLGELRRALAPGSRLFVCEYRPDAPGAVGPPLERRIAPDRLRGLATDAGFAIGDRFAYDNESYALLLL